MKSNFNFILLTITLSVLLYTITIINCSNTLLQTQSDDLNTEKNLALVEQLSKISQIKSIENEITDSLTKRLNPNTNTNDEINNNNNKDKTNPNKKISKKTNTFKINSNLTIDGVLTTSSLEADDLKVKSKVDIGGDLQAKFIKSESVKSVTSVLNSLSSPLGVITIQGDLIINNDVVADNVNLRGTSFVLDGVKQWQLAHHNDFNSNDSNNNNNNNSSLDGWSDKRLSRCGNNSNNYFLGGHCKFSFNEISKTFKNLPEHNHLRINALFHMFDKWEGESAYMKIDNEIVWTKVGKHSEKGINICGGEYNDPAFALPIDAGIPHNKESVLVTFGSTLKKDACDSSFGIDDVMVYVK